MKQKIYRKIYILIMAILLISTSFADKAVTSPEIKPGYFSEILVQANRNDEVYYPNGYTSVYVDAKNTIYATTPNSGLLIGYKNDQGKYHFEQYTTKNGLGNNSVDQVYVDKNDIVYAATDSGLSMGSKQSDGTYKFRNYSKGLESMSNHTNQIFMDKHGNIYLGTGGELGMTGVGAVIIGIKQPDGNYIFKSYDQKNGLDPYAAIVYGIYVDNSGTIYAATDDGLSIGAKQFDDSYKFIQPITENILTSIYVDTNGKIYATDMNDALLVGAKQIDNKYKFIEYPDDALTSVSSLYVDRDGTIYAATQPGVSSKSVCSGDPDVGGGLAIGKKYPDGRYHFKVYTNGLKSINVNGISVQGNNLVYAATQDGLYYGSFPELVLNLGKTVVFKSTGC